MLKRAVKIITMLPILLLAGCNNKYVSSFVTRVCTTSNLTNKGSIAFDEFKGRYVFKLKRTSDGDGAITYQGKIDEGSVTIFYDTNDVKENMFTLTGPEETSGVAGYVTKNKLVYIVIESDGWLKKGEFVFNLN